MAHAEKLVGCAGDVAHGSENLDFEKTAVDGVCEFGDGLEEDASLADLIGCLFESALRSIDSPVAVLDVLLKIANVVVFEAKALSFALW